MLVKDIMSEDVHTISPDFSVKKAAEAMTKRKVGSLIVVSGKKLEGIVTERDILKKAVCLGKDVNKTKVRDVMTKNIIFIEPGKDVDDAATLMTEKQIKRLPVVFQNRLIGIVTAMDIVTAEPKITESMGSLIMLAKNKKVVAG